MKVRRGNVGWKCVRSLGKHRGSEGSERECRLEVCKKCRKTQRFGEQMEVGSVRRVRGMVGAVPGRTPVEFEA